MATILFFLFVWLICKAVKAAFKPRAKPVYKAIQEKPKINYVSAVMALQQQRDNIENTIAELTCLLDVSETAKETIQIKNQISAQYGKLATVEQKITKLIS